MRVRPPSTSRTRSDEVGQHRYGAIRGHAGRTGRHGAPPGVILQNGSPQGGVPAGWNSDRVRQPAPIWVGFSGARVAYGARQGARGTVGRAQRKTGSLRSPHDHPDTIAAIAAINAIAANTWIAAMPMAAATARLSRHILRNP